MHDSTFGYLNPTDEQKDRMNRLREGAALYAKLLDTLLHDGADKTWCLRNHRTTAMWANVAATREADGTPRD
jgi:hypothetical protein